MAHDWRMRVLILAVGLLAACSPAAEKQAPAAETAAAAPGVAVAFMAPSGNVGCVYVPAGGTAVYQTSDGAAELSCDRVEPTYVRITLPEHGAARLIEHVGDPSCCSGQPFADGDAWEDGPFECQIAEEEIVCRSTDGHGFILNRAQADVR